MNRTALLLSIALPAGAAQKPPLAELSEEVRHPSGAFSFRTPAGWSARMLEDRSDVFEAKGGGLMVRFYFKPQELGLDALHVTCMELRLLGPMETSPQVQYAHDFLGGALGARRLLDSAFDVRYDREVHGASEWRQRNVTIVGEGESLCAIAYAPRQLFRKSKPVRALLDGILGSVSFRPSPPAK